MPMLDAVINHFLCRQTAQLLLQDARFDNVFQNFDSEKSDCCAAKIMFGPGMHVAAFHVYSLIERQLLIGYY